MKNNLIAAIIVCLIAITGCKDSGSDTNLISEVTETELSKFDADKELDAILAVIKSETECFFKRDYECWKKNWINKDYIALTWNEPDGTYEANIGWEAVSKSTLQHFKDHPLGGVDSSHPIIKREDIRVKFYGENAAYLTWKQYNSSQDENKFHISRDVRVMEKINGDWKIANVSAFWDYNNPVELED